MQARLKVLHNKANVKQVKLLPVTLIGRSTECNLKIASSQVSRTHCRITLGEDVVYVEDLGSANGTTVDGKLLEPHQPQSVVPGATLIVGPAAFLIDYVASTSATMVLSRLDAPISPNLSSTELLIPTKRDAASHLAAPLASPTVIPVAKPVVAQVVASPIAAIPIAAPESPVPSPLLPEAAAERDQAPLEMSFADFGPGADEPAANEDNPFSFAQSSSSDGSPAPFPMETSESPTPKKSGVKSLLSMFGRKAKGPASATSPASETTAKSDAPSVFLPTMDRLMADASTVEPDAEPTEFRFDELGTHDSAAGTVTLEDSPTTPPPAAVDAVASTPPPADYDDGFQQFLKQL